MKTQLPKNFQLNNYVEYYTISLHKRDVFYFKKASFFEGFPKQININTSVFKDQLLDYCERKMNTWDISEEKLEFYIIKYFNRVLQYKSKYELFKIDDYLLDKNGRLSIVSLNYYGEKIKNVFFNLELYFQINECFSTNYNWWLYHFIKKLNIDFQNDYDFAELSRQDFEKELNSDNIKFEYVENYHPKNKFYFEFIKNDDGFTTAKIVFYMTTDDDLNLFFLKNEYH